MLPSLTDTTDLLVVKANMDTEAKNRLTEEELLAQMWYGAWFDLHLLSLA